MFDHSLPESGTRQTLKNTRQSLCRVWYSIKRAWRIVHTFYRALDKEKHLTTFSKHSQIFITASTYDIMTCGQVSLFSDFIYVLYNF
jgi:hypothetical protein